MVVVQTTVRDGVTLIRPGRLGRADADVLDYHLHLWPHAQSDAEATVEQVAAYCERAVAAGGDRDRR